MFSISQSLQTLGSIFNKYNSPQSITKEEGSMNSIDPQEIELKADENEQRETKNIEMTAKCKTKQEQWEDITYHKCFDHKFDGPFWFLFFGVFVVFYPWFVTALSSNEPNLTIFYGIIHGIIIVNTVIAILTGMYYLHKVIKFHTFDYGKVLNTNDAQELKIKHIVQILWYNEPVSIIEETIDYVKNTEFMNTSEKVIIAIAFEERSNDIDGKKEFIITKYRDHFLDILFTIHPSNLPNNTRGTCSNVAWSTKDIYQQLMNKDYDDFNDKEYLVTKFDTDTLIHPKYLAGLEYNYLNRMKETNNECETIFVPKLCYEYELHERPWFVRSQVRVRPFTLNSLNATESMVVTIYSIPLNLHFRGGFQCPYNVAEDTITWLKYSIFIGKKIKLQVVPHYIINGTTAGTTLNEEISELGKQYGRWSMGIAQLVGIMGKYTFTGNFTGKEVVDWFVNYMVFCLGYLIYNSFYVFILISHILNVVMYPSGSSWIWILVHLITLHIIPSIITVAAINYMLKHDMIHIAHKDPKNEQSPVLSVLEMMGSIVPISIGNYYTVKMYLQSVIYGQSVYGHTVANKESLSSKKMN